MSVQAYPWERPLHALAIEALEHHRSKKSGHERDLPQPSPMLQEAYGYCEALTRNYSRTFYLASSLLNGEKRRAMRALYAFCRVTDELVDGDMQASRAALESWRSQAFASHLSAGHPVALAWADTRARFQIPRRFGDQLIDGVAQDLEQMRYERFSDLVTYCYRVASTVGLMAMHIIGFSGPEAIPYAIRLGVALQLTNILRDVGEDWNSGRLYLPQQELCQFGLTEADIAAASPGKRWRAFLRFQIIRNHRLYEEALPGIAMLDRDGRLAVTAAAEFYRAILVDIEKNQGDVFRRRATVSAGEKIRRLPAIWMKSREQQKFLYTNHPLRVTTIEYTRTGSIVDQDHHPGECRQFHPNSVECNTIREKPGDLAGSSNGAGGKHDRHYRSIGICRQPPDSPAGPGWKTRPGDGPGPAPG